jgi:hypothetical protein
MPNPNIKPAQKAEPSGQTAKPAAAPAKKKSGFQVVLRQIGLALLFLVIGMLAVLLALYLPLKNQLNNTQAEIDKLAPAATQYIELQASSAKNEARTLVYKMMSNTSQLKEAVTANDSYQASQQLTYIEQDLSKLELSDFPNLPANLTSQLEAMKSSISSNASTASSQVDRFYNSLLNLSSNLQ